ncbi:calcium-binding protein CML42-like [Tasmannia lanceolata]|uniref:calcium-binding protein CML42-like n=1 Tax=Tasmannia lanceolata TaxID=3420 RepID=UPI0040628ADD
MGAEAKPILAKPSPSFRLRSSSLNALRLRRIFEVFDHNGDGVITIAELSQALKRLGLEADTTELESMVKNYIKPGKFGLEYEDFESLHRSLGDTLFGGMDDHGVKASNASVGAQEESDLSEAFKVFDEDGDGFISARELQAVLGKLGLPEGREIDRVRKMICSVDKNCDGQVDFLEFKHMMQSVSVRTI